MPDLTNGPPVVAVTSLSPDHLDWHGSVERYYADKLSLCTKPGVRDGDRRRHQCILRRAGRRRWVLTCNGWTPHDAMFGGPWVDALGLPGEHNVRNAAMARAVLRAMGVAEAGDDARMEAAAAGFAGLPSRCHSIGHVGWSSSSTTACRPTCSRPRPPSRPTAIARGPARRGSRPRARLLGLWAQAVAAATVPTLVVTMPDNGPRIGSAIREVVG